MKIIWVPILLILFPANAFALSPDDVSSLKSCSGKDDFFCFYLKSDMDSCIIDPTSTIEGLSDFNKQTNGHEKETASYILYTHIQAYTRLADLEDGLVANFDNHTDELIKKYIETGGNKENGEFYKNDIKTVKKYCADKFKESAQKLRDLVPVSLQKEYDKQIRNQASTYKWMAREESANHTEQGFFRRLFSLVGFKLKGLFK